MKIRLLYFSADSSIQNWKKHVPGARGLEARSSAAWFTGWQNAAAATPRPAPVVAPRTWLALVGWKRIEVPGATGYIDTDYAAKGRYAINALTQTDLICLHVEATDEASHQGDTAAKIAARVLAALRSPPGTECA